VNAICSDLSRDKGIARRISNAASHRAGSKELYLNILGLSITKDEGIPKAIRTKSTEEAIKVA
jgi:hypothetical protein